MDPHAPHLLRTPGRRALDVRRGLDVLARADGVFLVVRHVEVDAERLQSVGQARDGAHADAHDRVLRAVDGDHAGELPLRGRGVLRGRHGAHGGLALGGTGRCGLLDGGGGWWWGWAGCAHGADVVVYQGETRVLLEMVRLLEQALDLAREQFAALLVGFALDDLAERYLQAAREVEVQTSLDDPRHTAFAGLTVHPDDGLVGAPDVLRVEGQVRHHPRILTGHVSGLAVVEALLDGVLVAAAEGTDDQLSAVRPALVNGDFGALLADTNDRVDVAEVDVRPDALRVEVQRKRD